MLRGLYAGTVLALTASAALASPVEVVSGGSYDFVTSSSAPAAYGTTTTPPVGGIGSVGGLCSPGIGNCPGLLAYPADYPTGVVVPYPGDSNSLAIEITIPDQIQYTQYLLSVLVTDDIGSTFASPHTPSNPTTGNVYELVLDGTSLGTTSGVPLGGVSTTIGTFSDVLPRYGTYYLGITDLLEPYANLAANDGAGLADTLPNSGGGNVTPATWADDIVGLSLTITPTPEPASLALLGAGLVGFGIARRRRKR